MIIYFSATGNTRFVAEGLAALLDDEACDLCPRIRTNDFTEMQCGKTLVVCSPVHISGLPKFLSDYLRRASFSGVEEASESSPTAGTRASRGASLQASCGRRGFASRALPSSCFPASTLRASRIERSPTRRLRSEYKRLPSSCPMSPEPYARGEGLEGRRASLAEVALTEALMPGLRFVGLGTRKFWASERCVSCGLCERVCPVVAITMREGRPTWNMSHCAHCMACIHNCPKEAIEYGNVTRDKRRYTFARYRHAAENKE